MRRLFSVLALTVLAFMFVWSVTTVHVIHVQQFCAGIREWRIIFDSPSRHTLTLSSGIYMASTYSLENGFGLRGVTRTSIVVP